MVPRSVDNFRSEHNVSSNDSESIISVFANDYIQFSDSVLDNEEQTQPCPEITRQPVTDNYFLAKLSFTYRSGPLVNG
jgi:hypothetical protein